MQDYKIIRYSPEYFQQWNDFIASAKNATFLFHRNFMEYHKDRFEDYSLMIFKGEKLLAVLPANRKGETLYSHQGLSYGGLVVKSAKMFFVADLFKAVLNYLNRNGLTFLELKIMPRIYSEFMGDCFSYMMFILKANLLKRETLSTVSRKMNIPFSKDRLAGIKRGVKNNLEIVEDDVFNDFWNDILIPNLKKRYNTKPVHSLREIELLKSQFPDDIKQFNVYFEGNLVAGTTIFITQYVAHSQYISSNHDNNNKLGSLDFLHDYLIHKAFKDKTYFDLGSSNINEGKNINKGLQYWKEGFGAQTVTQDFYKIDSSKYSLLNAVFK